ncbi:hypothetical protein V2S66_26120 [Streptomyces sp. V4-01]|uniref:Uncharacterized protein n=1 Tax=Actinacidiphila polyblastidii TaxID=3110430 RepID=A0ABU7PHX6_9ACTN|nr:hypothetical protein [Streptomyces sp. V4-01]
MFPSDAAESPLLARSDRLIRLGAALPMLAFGVIAVTARLLDPSQTTFVVEMLTVTLCAQSLTWCGLVGVWRCAAWNSGVLFYIWFGGTMGVLTLLATAIPAVMPIPLLAPLVATFARWRAGRRARPAVEDVA